MEIEIEMEIEMEIEIEIEKTKGLSFIIRSQLGLQKKEKIRGENIRGMRELELELELGLVDGRTKKGTVIAWTTGHTCLLAFEDDDDDDNQVEIPHEISTNIDLDIRDTRPGIKEDEKETKKRRRR